MVLTPKGRHLNIYFQETNQASFSTLMLQLANKSPKFFHLKTTDLWGFRNFFVVYTNITCKSEF